MAAPFIIRVLDNNYIVVPGERMGCIVWFIGGWPLAVMFIVGVINVNYVIISGERMGGLWLLVSWCLADVVIT